MLVNKKEKVFHIEIKFAFRFVGYLSCGPLNIPCVACFNVVEKLPWFTSSWVTLPGARSCLSGVPTWVTMLPPGQSHSWLVSCRPLWRRVYQNAHGAAAGLDDQDVSSPGNLREWGLPAVSKFPRWEGRTFYYNPGGYWGLSHSHQGS